MPPRRNSQTHNREALRVQLFLALLPLLPPPLAPVPLLVQLAPSLPWRRLALEVPALLEAPVVPEALEALE